MTSWFPESRFQFQTLIRKWLQALISKPLSLRDLRGSTTDFVSDQDPNKQVTKITIMSHAQKPITEFKERSKRDNSMFHSGYVNRPAGGAGRFGQAGANSKPQEVAAVQRQSLTAPGTTMTDSTYMSTSMYMGNIVTNRFANAGNAPIIKNDRGSNIMYHSQTVNVGNQATPSFGKNLKQDMKNFTIPAKVQQYLDNGINEFKYLEKDVNGERQKMNAELDSIQQTILEIIQLKRSELNGVFDSYMNSFKTNLEITRQKAAAYKDPADWAKLQASENGDRPVRLTAMAYYAKDPSSSVYKLWRTEPHKSICELRNLNQEVRKHNLEFSVAELERMGIHYPAFANTASSAEYLGEVRERLISSVRTGMTDFGQLTFAAPVTKLDEILSEPRIFPSLGEIRLNCLSNIRELSSPSCSCKTGLLSHESPITTILNLDDDSFATGDQNGSVHVYHVGQDKETHKFRMKGITQVTCLGRIRTTLELVGEEEMRASQAAGEVHDRNIFLVSGHAKPDCVVSIWDLKRQAFVKQLRGHTDDVTAISSLQDGHTLLTGSKSGATIIFGLAKKKPIKSFQSLTNSPVNCLYTFNDLSKFAVGHDNGEIVLYKVVYDIDMQTKLAVCSTADSITSLKAKSPALCLNESHTRPDILISGHADGLVRVWDLMKATVLKEIGGHTGPVVGLLVIENPFGVNLEENYHLLSFGENQDDIYFYQPKQNKQFQLKFPLKLDYKGLKGRNPKIQMYREGKDSSDNGINFATFANNEDGKKQIIFASIK
jgi:WD40 repeat protein